MPDLTDRRVRAAVEFDFARAHSTRGCTTAGSGTSVQRVSRTPRRTGHRRAPPADPFDAALLNAHEDGLRVRFAEAEEHRSNPLLHAAAMDLACPDREYAPLGERRRAGRRAGLWPSGRQRRGIPGPGVGGKRRRVPGLRSAAWRTARVDDDRARAAVARLTAHVEATARRGEPSAAVGEKLFLRLLNACEATDHEIGGLARAADQERVRLQEILHAAVERLAPGGKPAEVVPALMRDHPVTARDVIAEASDLIRRSDPLRGRRPDRRSRRRLRVKVPPPPALMPEDDDVVVGAVRRTAPSWYYVVPPDPAWPPEQAEEWLAVFSRTSLPAITVHEVTPGHYGRALRAPRPPVSNRPRSSRLGALRRGTVCRRVSRGRPALRDPEWPSRRCRVTA